MKTVWGEILKELRVERQLSFRQVSVDTGINRIMMRRIEMGEVPGSIEIVEKLLDYYGYELDAIQKIPTSLLPMRRKQLP